MKRFLLLPIVLLVVLTSLSSCYVYGPPVPAYGYRPRPHYRYYEGPRYGYRHHHYGHPHRRF